MIAVLIRFCSGVRGRLLAGVPGAALNRGAALRFGRDASSCEASVSRRATSGRFDKLADETSLCDIWLLVLCELPGDE